MHCRFPGNVLLFTCQDERDVAVVEIDGQVRIDEGPCMTSTPDTQTVYTDLDAAFDAILERLGDNIKAEAF